MGQRAIGFLRPSEERIVLIFPLLALLTFAVLWSTMNLNANLKSAFFFLAGVAFFIDVTHLLVTYLMLASVPELRKWWTSREALKGVGVLKGLLPRDRAIFMGVAIAIGFIVANFSSWSNGLRMLAATWILYDIIGPTQHTIAQVKGISLCYNNALKRDVAMTPDELSKAARVEKTERLLFRLLFIADLFFAVPFIIEGYLFERFDLITPYRIASGLVLFAVVIAIFVNGRRFPHQSRSNKTPYLLRILLYPLKMFSIPVSTLAIRANHGVEYFFFCRNIIRNSSASAKRIKVASAVFGMFVLGTLILVLLGVNSPFKFRDERQPDLLLAGFMVFSFTHQFLHFYLDSIIFRLSDSYTRQQVRPLIMGANLEATAELPAKKEVS